MVGYISQAIALALVAHSAVQAHSVFSNLIVDGQDQANNNCIRKSTVPGELNFPILDFGSNDMVCNVGGQNGVEGLCAVNDGANLSIHWSEVPNQADSRAINPSHKGPCAVYMKKVNSATEDSGQGNGWFKIFEQGYDESSGEWCIDKLNANNGILSFKVPSGLAGGDYLMRADIIALHRAHEGAKEPEFYAGCAQITLESDGNGTPSETVSIPGYIDGSEPGVNFNLFDGSDPATYQFVGPSVVGDFSGSGEGSGNNDDGSGSSDGSDGGSDGNEGSDDSNGSDVAISGSALGTRDDSFNNGDSSEDNNETEADSSAPNEGTDTDSSGQGQGQDSCNGTTMVTVTVTATADDGEGTGSPDE